MEAFYRSLFLRHVHYFVAAAEYGSFRQAAAALNVRQSSVSRYIRDLEVRFGEVLFYRSPKGVVLTGAGYHLLVPLREVLNKLQKADHPPQVEVEGIDSRITVGLSPFLNPILLPQLVRLLQSSGRDIALTFFDQGSLAKDSRYGRHDVDIAIVPHNLADRLALESLFLVNHVAVLLKKNSNAIDS